MGNKDSKSWGFFPNGCHYFGGKPVRTHQAPLFLCKIFLILCFDYSEVIAFSGKQNTTWKNPAALGKDEDWNIILPCL